MTAIAATNTTLLSDLVDGRARAHQIAVGLLAVVFLTIYGRLVCPFIDGVKVPELLFNLGLVFVVQSIAREVLLAWFPQPPEGRSLPRHGYYLAIAGWVIAGLVALAVHYVRYEDFPLNSHVKLALGYFLIGGGLLAQWEYVVLEGAARKRDVRYVNARQYLERITRRVMEGFVLFTLVPSLAMVITMARFRYEGLVDRGMVIEMSFLGGFCVLLALAVSVRFGQSLREDARSVLQATERIQRGERNVVIDTSRMDEIGAVASGINSMYRELEARKARLEKQLVEREATSKVSLAMSSVMEPGRILDLIVENSKLVTHAEASSLLLLDEVTGELSFHVAKGSAAAGLARITVAPGKGIVGHVAATGQPLLIADAYADPRFDRSHDERTGFRTRSLLTVPMHSKGVVIGVVQVINKAGEARFDEDDLQLLESFAAQAGVSLENARLLDKTRRMADDLRVALEKERRLSIEKAKMGAYIPKTVVDEISKSREETLALGGKTVPATVLFSDIKGFTALSERLDPQETVAFLNVYMTAMTGVIEEEGGIVDKFIGDGIMAVFAEGGGHATAAVRAGVRMQKKLDEMRHADPALRNLQMRIGINTGDVVAGNIGSQTRMEYTVIGDNVNVASRIEGACAPDKVLVSASTWQSVREGFVAEEQHPIRVKNRSEPVKTFLIRGFASAPA
jgi:class 3 adenylate cyclase/GAF domain-containing protein